MTATLTPSAFKPRMTAVEISVPGIPEVLRLAQRPCPQPGPGEVLIEVAAAGINRPDIMQRKGIYPPPPGASDIPGLEVAGVVVQLGEAVSGLSLGDRVCALVAGGGYAQYCVAPAEQCLPVPRGISTVSAAALPETCFTVWSNVFERARLQPGESLLVQGGSSGIGVMAIQMARALGSRVFATAGSAAKCRACEALGAERAIDYKNEDFVAVVKTLTDGRGVDVVLDMVGGDYLARELSALAEDGRAVLINSMKGNRAQVNLVELMVKRLTLTGSTLRSRPLAYKAALARALRAQIWPLLEAGTIHPVVYRSYPLEQAAQAHALMESGEHIGKIILTL
jgi:NADPH:quinone reductase